MVLTDGPLASDDDSCLYLMSQAVENLQKCAETPTDRLLIVRMGVLSFTVQVWGIVWQL